MEGKSTLPRWYSGLNEMLIELSIEDPEAYKQWFSWYESTTKRPPWLMRRSKESLERLKAVIDSAIKERRWTCASLKEGADNTWSASILRRDNIRHCGKGSSACDALLDAYLSALKGCRGSEICPWMP